MNYCKINSKKIFYIFTYILIIGGIFFSVLFFTNQIKYGNVIEKYVDTDQFARYSNKDVKIFSSDIVKQELTYDTGSLDSFSLKYHIDRFEKGLEFEIELHDLVTDAVLQTWNEDGKQLNPDGFKEYKVESDISDRKAYLIIKANKDNSALFFSETDSLLGADLYLNQEIQTGDLILQLKQIKNVSATLIWAAMLSMIAAILMVSFFVFRIYVPLLCKIRSIRGVLKRSKVPYIKDSLMIIIIIFVSIVTEIIFSKYNILNFEHNTPGSFNEFRGLFVCVILTGIYLFIRLKDNLENKPEKVFAILFFLIGILYVIVIPAEAEVSWDESIHYWRAVNVSHALSGEVNAAESWLYWQSGTGFHLPNSIENLRNMHQQVQIMYDNANVVSGDTDILNGLYSIAYIPSSIGLAIGRVLHMPYVITFHMGAAMNLILYILLVYLGIKRLHSGKMILVAVSGTLSLMFLATVYSSDSWIAGFTFLGVAYFIGNMQEKGKMSRLDMAIMLGAFTLGFLPKTIYCPLFLLYLLIPQQKFHNEKQAAFFRISTISLMICFALEAVLNSLFLFIPLLAISYIIVYVSYRIQRKLSKNQKILLGSIIILCSIVFGYLFAYYILPAVLGQGDLRGGADVDSSAQLRFILQHPVKYLEILGKFIIGDYLSFQNALQSIFKTFGYIGDSSLQVISFVFLWIVAFTDKRTADLWKNYNKVRVIVIMISGVIICLMATALYISFTSVGNTTIVGCQPRYLIPLLFPFFALIGSNKIRNDMSLKVYNGIIIGGASLILIIAIWQTVICLYA